MYLTLKMSLTILSFADVLLLIFRWTASTQKTGALGKGMLILWEIQGKPKKKKKKKRKDVVLQVLQKGKKKKIEEGRGAKREDDKHKTRPMVRKDPISMIR